MENVKNSRIGIDLTEGNVAVTLLRFAVPILLTNLIQQFYSTVDLIVAGQFIGSIGTVGVSTGGEFAELLTFFSTGFASAGQIYIAQLCGSGSQERIRRATGTLITFMLGMSLVFSAVLILFSAPILHWQNCPQEAFAQAQNYMTITALGFPFIFGYNAICGILRGMGESKRPLLFISIAATANIFMDVFLVVVIPLAVAGTAIATVIAQFATFVASLAYLYRKRAMLGIDFRLKSFAIHRAELLVLLKLGIPLSLQSVLIHFTQIYCNSLVNQYGLVASATNSVGNKLFRFVNIIVTSLSQASGAVVGQNLGARKLDRVKATVYVGLGFNFLICALNCIMVLLIPREIFSVFTEDPDVIAFGVVYLRVCIITFILSAWMGPFGAVVTGAGNAALNLISGVLDGVVLRLGISLFCAYVLNLGVIGFFLGNSLARLAPCIINAVYFYSGKWKTCKLLS